MILDAGILISIDRNEQAARQFVVATERSGRSLHTSHPVVAQVWRGENRQARLARFVGSLERHPFADGRSVGRLLGRSGTSDVVDAHLVLLAAELGQDILTGDVNDLRALGEALAAEFGASAPVIHSWP